MHEAKDEKINEKNELHPDQNPVNEPSDDTAVNPDGVEVDAVLDDDALKVQQMGEKLAELNDKYLRLYSEYENYRKRTSAEKADLVFNGGKEVVKAVLPVVDDLERALNAMSDENAKEGVTMIYNKLLNTLQQLGLKPMDSIGQKFDENLHEAVTQVPAPSDDKKGTVLDVVQKGYFFHDKVLRFAKVVYAC